MFEKMSNTRGDINKYYTRSWVKRTWLGLKDLRRKLGIELSHEQYINICPFIL